MLLSLPQSAPLLRASLGLSVEQPLFLQTAARPKLYVRVSLDQDEDSCLGH